MRRGPFLQRPARRAFATSAPVHRKLPAPDLHWHVEDSTVSYARLKQPWTSNESALLRAPSLIPASVLEATRQLLPQLQLDRGRDSVDGMPMFQVQFVAQGRFVHDQLAAVFRESLLHRVLPLLRRSRLSPAGVAGPDDLVLCEALLRVYDEDQRRLHPAHYDADAFLTAMFEVDTLEVAPPAFYIQAGAHTSSRVPIDLAPGDLVAHSYDIQHGVQVAKGRRCSVILWFTDNQQACVDKSRPWYRAAAATGDVAAILNLAMDLRESQPETARALMMQAAGSGHFVAQNELGVEHLTRYLDDPTLGGELDEAERWLTASASQGFWRAEDNMALVCAERGQEGEALAWLRRSAEQKADPEQAFQLGMHHWRGSWSAERDVESVREWIGHASAMGHPAAQLAMAKLAVTKEEMWLWLRRAAVQGYVDAEVVTGTSTRVSHGPALEDLLQVAVNAEGEVHAIELPPLRLLDGPAARASSTSGSARSSRKHRGARRKRSRRPRTWPDAAHDDR